MKKELRIIQKNEIIILKEIKRICVKHNISYYLSSGTLLGAVRHNGFIPWDDDIDIEIPLKDYYKFLKICKTELGSRFFLQNYKTEPNFYGAYSKIRLNNTTFMPSHHTKYHIHQGFWVDVFPVVRVSKSLRLRSIQKRILQISNYIQIGDYINANYEEFYQLLGGKKIKTVLRFNKTPLFFRRWIHSLLLVPIMINPKMDTPLASVFTSYGKAPNNVFVDLVEHEFEDDYYNIPVNYDECLKQMYGDYMQLPPENERKGHGDSLVDENSDFTKYLDK